MQGKAGSRLKLPVLELPHFQGLSLPRYVTDGAAGVDLPAAIHEPITLSPGDIRLVPTGLCVAIPSGYEIQIRPRSGLAIKHGITVVNAPGTIDSDYRGEIKIGLINLGKDDFTIERGMRIAQAILSRTFRIHWEECDSLPESSRGEGGFGHTGV
jgi:dUTP pyrophosphatase